MRRALECNDEEGMTKKHIKILIQPNTNTFIPSFPFYLLTSFMNVESLLNLSQTCSGFHNGLKPFVLVQKEFYNLLLTMHPVVVELLKRSHYVPLSWKDVYEWSDENRYKDRAYCHQIDDELFPYFSGNEGECEVENEKEGAGEDENEKEGSSEFENEKEGEDEIKKKESMLNIVLNKLKKKYGSQFPYCMLRGDLVAIGNDDYRNSGLYIFTGNHIVDLDHSIDDYGGVPRGFECIEIFPPAYFSSDPVTTDECSDYDENNCGLRGIVHNSYIVVNHKLFIDQILATLAYNEADLSISTVPLIYATIHVKSRKYYLLLSEEDMILYSGNFNNRSPEYFIQTTKDTLTKYNECNFEFVLGDEFLRFPEQCFALLLPE